MATGSWNKHVYNLSYSGSAGDDHSWKYFISASRQMAGDSKYHDELTNKDYTYQGTSYKDEGVNFHVTKDFDDNHGIDIWYNHQNGLDHYPITAPDYRYWSQTEWDRIIQGTVDGYYSNVTNPGYRNLFVLDALSGSYNAYRNNDIDVKYTFDRSNGMESLCVFTTRAITIGALIDTRNGHIITTRSLFRSPVALNGMNLLKITHLNRG